jgi:hypothetical protein
MLVPSRLPRFLFGKREFRIFKGYDTNGKSSPITGLEWPRGFQEVKVPRFRDNGPGWW